ncbi:serine/threonine-protein kinase AfsK-like [Echinops telfairi]|uniref:Serine/threonine-protein kinase AfsK-like n=1 Tax=Echinops telfairi TaxID=9371 RepID=A0AC55CMV4_ECHTE|nr:serine/threonine-protein kinase AfsK-like [Echinops telfairi]
MEIWDSLNRRYLDFIKKQGARQEESWLFRGLREPGGGRAEELARRAHGPGFLPKKGKAGKKCEATAGHAGERRPRDGAHHGRLTAPGARAAAGAGARSPKPRRARRRNLRRTALLCPAARRGPAACRLRPGPPRPPSERARRWPPLPCPPRSPRHPRTLGLSQGLTFRSH